VGPVPRVALRTLLTALTVAGSLALATGVASAHVTVTPTSVPAGQDATLTFRVPDERDDASTVGLRLVLADGAALHEVSVLAKPGWDFSTAAPSGTATNSPQPTVPQSTATAAPQATPMPNMPGMSGMGGMSGMSRPGGPGADTSTPAPSASSSAAPDGDDGGPAIGSISWTARDSSAGIAPGTFGEFAISAAMPADRASLVFAAIQTYSDGTVVRWIDRAAPGSAEPAHPAPTVTLGSGDPMAGMSMPGMSSATPAPATGGSTNMAMSGMSGMDMSGSKSDSVNVALVVAIAALIAAMTAAVLAMNALSRARGGRSGDH
jgi:uncharacterized protein YcnI